MQAPSSDFFARNISGKLSKFLLTGDQLMDIICRFFDRPHRILTQLRGLCCVSRGAAYQLSKKILKYF
jgi:hypothetical protein